jgi:hypothetical protein
VILLLCDCLGDNIFLCFCAHHVGFVCPTTSLVFVVGLHFIHDEHASASCLSFACFLSFVG